MSGSTCSNKIFPTNETTQILLDQLGFCQQGTEVVRQNFCQLASKICLMNPELFSLTLILSRWRTEERPFTKDNRGRIRLSKNALAIDVSGRFHNGMASGPASDILLRDHFYMRRTSVCLLIVMLQLSSPVAFFLLRGQLPTKMAIFSLMIYPLIEHLNGNIPVVKFR